MDAGLLPEAKATSDAALALLDKLNDRSWTVALSASKAHVLAARIAAATGDTSGALTHLQAATDDAPAPELGPDVLPTLPELKPLEGLPGFQALLEKLRERAQW